MNHSHVGESVGISEIRRFASPRSLEALLTRIFAFMRPGSSGKNIKKNSGHYELTKKFLKNFRK